MKKLLSLIAVVLISIGAQAQSKVYFTKEISPESLVKIYKALGVEAKGRVAVKISTGEGGNPHYLKPTLIRNLVEEVNGTIVECCTAYGGTRQDKGKHWETIHEHGFDSIFAVDIMDEYDQIRIPIKDKKRLKYDIVGGHLANYDFMINLAHFKGHPMAGYGGVIKNQSIGVSSANGKLLIHSAGRKGDMNHRLAGWSSAVAATPQDEFLESMAAAAQSVADYLKGRIVYINVMNNLSVDCDCMANPDEPQMQDVGILASTDPVALDQACIDLVWQAEGNESLVRRVELRDGLHTLEYAAEIGLGSRTYSLVDLDA